ncbi:low molecular weight phosphatase family protein [Georgenia sp. Z1344]|uniref:arsenate reductase/protein-tyrosine-phosphatase family protein n=1 Tax=Georgenia sp. Z1344 TaxID=3416706 RepID=UPI003CF4E79D
MSTADVGTAAAPELRILTVCTGNICRSPAAERLLRHRFGAGSGIEVTSAGVGALVGAPIDEPVVRLLTDRGVDTTDFAARALTERIASSSDIVLTATREHRAAVVEVAPALVRRSFTLLELARLVGQVDEADLVARAGDDATPAARLKALAALAARHRVQVPRELDDVADPYRGSPEEYRVAIDAVAEAVDTIADRVLGRA